MHGPRGLSSRVSVTSHGSGGAFSVKDGAGGSHKTRKPSVAGSATFSHSLMNLTQVIFHEFCNKDYFSVPTILLCDMLLCYQSVNDLLFVSPCDGLS